jgi:hypothetical protein
VRPNQCWDVLRGVLLASSENLQRKKDIDGLSAIFAGININALEPQWLSETSTNLQSQ